MAFGEETPKGYKTMPKGDKTYVVVPKFGDPWVRPDGKTMITNKCGHEFAYSIKKPSAVKWLEGRPCPSCARKNPNKSGGAPKSKLDEIQDKFEGEQGQDETSVPAPAPAPEPEPEIVLDSEEIARIRALFPEPPSGVWHSVLPDVLLAVQGNLPVWLQGPPGTSKSTMAFQTSEALGLAFHPVSCHEMMTRTDLFGYSDANGIDHRTPLWDAYENGGILLLDEIDNGNPNLLAALNSAMSNGHCVFGSGTVVQRHDDFRVIATANTAGLGPEAGFIGRNGVDLATRDRFVTLRVPIEDKLELALAHLAAGDSDAFGSLGKKCRTAFSAKMDDRARQACLAPKSETVVRVVSKLRNEIELRFRGSVVSPRTTIHATILCHKGFSLREALTTKLVGLKDDEISSLLEKSHA